AFLGAHLRPGVEVVMDAIRLEPRMLRAEVAVTGEGRFDGQSLRGKAPSGVLRLAEVHRVPAVVLCGSAEVTVEGVLVASLADRFGPEEAMEHTRPRLVELAEEVARSFPASAG
ncbi:MAG TPA: glycerate kinase, partial [Actinomycetota bacterium]